jgi:hypothetical protein
MIRIRFAALGAALSARFSRSPPSIRRGLAAIVLLAATTNASTAFAHAVCGDRVFPATLIMDDPGVSDELSLPTITYLPIPAASGTPGGHSIDYGFEFDKTITEDLGFAINDDYFTQHGVGGPNLKGWNDLTLTLKDKFLCIEPLELMMSMGIVHEFGGTGSGQLRSAGAIDSTGSTAPTFYVGKGLGDYPIGMFRPFGLTGELGYQISDTPSVSPHEWDYSASLQYSMPYLAQHVKALDIPDFMNHLVPLVEVSMESPDRGPTTGQIAPGVIYLGNTYQVGVEALIPANRASRQLQGTGLIVQFHLFTDDLAYNTPIGRPLINRNLWEGQ